VKGSRDGTLKFGFFEEKLKNQSPNYQVRRIDQEQKYGCMKHGKPCSMRHAPCSTLYALL
jgi:hypothetical protein